MTSPYLYSLASAQASTLGQHGREHSLDPRIGDEAMLLSDIEELRHTMDRIEEELKREKASKQHDGH